jgi:hypothetical protein
VKFAVTVASEVPKVNVTELAEVDEIEPPPDVLTVQEVNVYPVEGVAVRVVVVPGAPDNGLSETVPPVPASAFITGLIAKLAVTVALEFPKVNVAGFSEVEEMEPPPASFRVHEEK